VAAGGGGDVAAGGGGAGVHCTSVTPATATNASVAIRLETSLGDESLPPALIPKGRCDGRFRWASPAATNVPRQAGVQGVELTGGDDNVGIQPRRVRR
jgi:hypothetical protein